MMRGRVKNNRPTGRFFCVLLWVALASRIGLASATLTTISDVVYRADGTPAAGTVVITWGNSQLAKRANNYFGIKARAGRASIEMPTLEFENGARKKAVARFASYGSMQECFADRDRIILQLPVYAAARACAEDPEQFVTDLAKHWATDPAYTQRLLRIYRDHQFDRLDRVDFYTEALKEQQETT